MLKYGKYAYKPLSAIPVQYLCFLAMEAEKTAKMLEEEMDRRGIQNPEAIHSSNFKTWQQKYDE